MPRHFKPVISYSFLILILIALLVFVGLSSCGGDGSKTPTGQFIDSAVQGLGYEASPSGKNGITDDDGKFKYKDGDIISFFLGDVFLDLTFGSDFWS